MAKLILLFSIFFITVTCSLNSKVPVNQKNACEIVKYKRSWVRAISKTEKKWGVSKGTQLSFILTESNFRPRAKTSRTYVFGIIPSGRLSSAYGYAQALDGTWDWYQKSTGNRSARRTNFSDSDIEPIPSDIEPIPSEPEFFDARSCDPDDDAEFDWRNAPEAD